ncbi:MAG: DUF952 domain-containing protein [Nocardioides sp.]|nr:DUF952 domain-containing protein [Nocardioides sp.]
MSGGTHRAGWARWRPCARTTSTPRSPSGTTARTTRCSRPRCSGRPSTSWPTRRETGPAGRCDDERVRIFHVATLADWAEAHRTGEYTTSTRGVSLAQEGFIHASRADQWERVLAAFYADVEEPLVLLEIDTDLLGVPVVEEPPAPDVAETFPHVYGAIRVPAVVAVTRLEPPR